MKLLIAAAGLAGLVAAQPPTPPACDTFPACNTCSAHSSSGCSWCSTSGCVDDSSSCGSDEVIFSDGICYPAYVVGDDGNCELASDDGEGMTLEACEAQAGAVKQIYRCNHETGSFDSDSSACPAYNDQRELLEYTVGCTDSDSGDCEQVASTTYSCDATSLTCVEDPYSSATSSECDAFCGQNNIDELAGDWASFPINADYTSEGANVRWLWSFEDDGTVVVTNPMGVGEAQLLRTGPTTYAMAFTNGTAAGSSMYGAYFPAPTGAATDSYIFTGAAPSSGPGSETLGSAALHVQMYGGGTGVHVLTRDNGGDPAPAPAAGTLSEEDDTLEGTWRGLSLTDSDSDVFAFTFTSDQSSVTWYDPTTEATSTDSVTLGDVDPDTGIQAIKIGDRSGLLLKTLGTDDSNTRLAYIALGAAGDSAPVDFRAPLDNPSDGTDEWALTACLLSDPGLCAFEDVTA